PLLARRALGRPRTTNQTLQPRVPFLNITSSLRLSPPLEFIDEITPSRLSSSPVARPRPGFHARRSRQADAGAARLHGEDRGMRADDPAAAEHFLRRARPHVGAAISPVPEPRRAQAGQAGPVPAHDLG